MSQMRQHSRASGIGRFFTGAGLPVFVIATVLVYEAFLLAVVLAPEGSGLWSAFATEFKVWCFDYDSRTGGMEWIAVYAMLMEPLFVALGTTLIWRRALADMFRTAGWWRHWRAGAAGAAIASVCVAGLFFYAARDLGEEEALPFPGERIRTVLEPPEFELIDQSGKPFSLEAMRGRVVLATGIYATCGTSCPAILLEIKNLLASLPEDNREQLGVVAFSLNPEYETTQQMSNLALGYGFKYPEFRYLNGDPKEMHEVLSRLQFARYRNEKTGVIEHSNLFLLIDREGKIAYRFSLDQRHLPWLREAVLALTDEAALAARKEAPGQQKTGFAMQ